MPVVVTGAAGFIGGMLTTALAADGAHVVAVDRRPVRVRYPGVVVLRADLLDRDQAVESALHEADAVYHLAGRSGSRDGDAETEQGLHHRDNVIAAAHVLAAVPLRTPMVVASSCAVYGGSAKGWPSHEDDTPNPLGSYARSKLALEWLCAQRAAAGGAVAVARPFTVAGEGQRPDMALARWIDALRGGRPLRIYGSPWRARDVTDIRDVVRSLRTIIERGVVGAVNIGSGAPRSLADLAIAACRAVGTPSEFVILPARADEPTATHADTRRHERLLGFRPVTDLDTLVRRQVAACLAHERATLTEETRLMHGGSAGTTAGAATDASAGGTGPTRMVERMLEARLVETRTVETPFEALEALETRFTDVSLPDDPFPDDPFPAAEPTHDPARTAQARETTADHTRHAGSQVVSTPTGRAAAPTDHDDPTREAQTHDAGQEHAGNTTDAGDATVRNAGVPEIGTAPTHTLTVDGLETVPGGAAGSGTTDTDTDTDADATHPGTFGSGAAESGATEWATTDVKGGSPPAAAVSDDGARDTSGDPDQSEGPNQTGSTGSGGGTHQPSPQPGGGAAAATTITAYATS